MKKKKHEIIFYVDSPSVTILSDKMISDVHDTVIVKCHICAIPKIIQINWLTHNQIINDVNIIIKTQSLDHYQCSESIMEIVVCLTHFDFLEKVFFFFE
jgi:hypothetical protein